MNKTIIINLYGAPGSGKSTGAAYIFYKLKQKGINCEIATEYAKDKVWEEHDEVFKDQCYIFGHQHFRISRLIGKVDVIITDSPLLLSSYYSTEELYKPELAALAKKSFKDNTIQLSYYINRVKPYNPKGRFQTEEESNIVAKNLFDYLIENKIGPQCVPGNEEGYDFIVNETLSLINKEINKKDRWIPNDPLFEPV